MQFSLTGLMGLTSSLALLASAYAEEIHLFNGKDLTGWKGVEGFWSVEDGAITGKTTPENPAKSNTYLVWQGGEPGDFVLTFKYRLFDAEGKTEGYANSGVQYRSKVFDEDYWNVCGYQADMELGKIWSGALFEGRDQEKRGRGCLAKRGQKVVVEDGDDPKKPKITVLGETHPAQEIQAAIKPGEWNEYKIEAKGNVLKQWINGKLSVHVTDKASAAAVDGVIAIQLHKGSPMKVQCKDLVLVTE